MDVTPSLSAIIIQRHRAQPIPTASSSGARLTHTLDAFLREATHINASLNNLLRYLKSIRQPYLSTAPAPRRTAQPQPQPSAKSLSAVPTYLTDEQREAIESETATLLRSLNSSITNLSAAANLQHDTATKLLHKKYGRPSSFLFRWAAGSDGDRGSDAGKSAQQVDEEGRTQTTKEFRDGVLAYLAMKLEEAVRRQRDMVERRMEREKEKKMSVLSDARNKGYVKSQPVEFEGAGFGAERVSHGGGENDYGNADLRAHDNYNPALDGGDGLQQDLSPEQLQLFEEENSSLLSHFNDQLGKITHAEKSLLEISSLQQTLLGHLTVQGEQIGNLVSDAEDTGTNLQKGNKELKKASERSSTAKAVFWATGGLCSFLVVWDLIF